MLFVIAFTLWLWWGGLLGAPAQLNATDTGYELVADDRVSVSWQLTTPVDAPAACAVQALNEAFGIVGWRVVDVPPSSEPVRQFTVELRTAEPAVTGLIYRCWLT